MEIEQIQILEAINEHGSINATAENLFLAKSHISRSIKQAEIEIGFKLLERDGYRVKLSPKAKMYLEKAQKLLKAHDDLKNYQKQLSNNIESSIKISSTVLYNLDNYINLIKIINKKFPQTSIYSEREVLSGEELLKQEKVELAIIENIQDSSNLESIKLESVNMPLVIWSNHKFLKQEKAKMTLNTLKQYPQIVLRSSLDLNKHSGGVYQDAIQWKVSDHHSKLELIRHGLGWGRMPEYLVAKDIERGKLKILKDIEKPLTVDIYLAKRKNYSYGKVAQFIWEALETQPCL